jgi:hypothetical protein
MEQVVNTFRGDHSERVETGKYLGGGAYGSVFRVREAGVPRAGKVVFF